MAAQLRQVPKYSHLCSETLERIAAWAQTRYPEKKALQAARRKLHQIYGAYIAQLNFSSLEKLTDNLEPGIEDEQLQATCQEILSCHTSTAERLPILKEFYPALFQEIGQPTSVLDLACGLNPFALPWMNLASPVRYTAFEIDHRLVAAINRFFTCLGNAPGAACIDILATSDLPKADVVFLFKTLPCLEQQEKGAGLELLRRLHTGHIVVSFPTRTLGGRTKGMEDHYETILETLAEKLGRPARKMAYPGETFYILEG